MHHHCPARFSTPTYFLDSAIQYSLDLGESSIDVLFKVVSTMMTYFLGLKNPRVSTFNEVLFNEKLVLLRLGASFVYIEA